MHLTAPPLLVSAHSNEEGNVSHRLGICRAEHVAF